MGYDQLYETVLERNPRLSKDLKPLIKHLFTWSSFYDENFEMIQKARKEEDIELHRKLLKYEDKLNECNIAIRKILGIHIPSQEIKHNEKNIRTPKKAHNKNEKK